MSRVLRSSLDGVESYGRETPIPKVLVQNRRPSQRKPQPTLQMHQIHQKRDPSDVQNIQTGMPSSSTHCCEHNHCCQLIINPLLPHCSTKLNAEWLYVCHRTVRQDSSKRTHSGTSSRDSSHMAVSWPRECIRQLVVTWGPILMYSEPSNQTMQSCSDVTDAVITDWSLSVLFRILWTALWAIPWYK